MCSDRVGNVPDANGVEVFAVAGLLNEYLTVHVVIIACGEYI